MQYQVRSKSSCKKFSAKKKEKKKGEEEERNDERIYYKNNINASLLSRIIEKYPREKYLPYEFIFGKSSSSSDQCQLSHTRLIHCTQSSFFTLHFAMYISFCFDHFPSSVNFSLFQFSLIGSRCTKTSAMHIFANRRR